MFPLIPVTIGVLIYRAIANSRRATPNGVMGQEGVRSCLPEIDEVSYTDNTYNIYTLAQLRSFMEQDDTNEKTYVKDSFDCDNFSVLFYAMAEQAMPGCMVGMVDVLKPTGIKHSINCFIDENKKFWLIEPQNDEILEPPSDWKLYWGRV